MTDNQKLTERQERKVRSALGLDTPLVVRGKKYATKRYYTTTLTDSDWEDLVARGLATVRRQRSTRHGYDVFYPTLECARAVLAAGEALGEGAL